MTLKFPVELIINGDEWKIQPFRFDVHAINTGSYTPSYRDVTVTGVSPLNLPNAEANGLRYIKLFGKCEQTPNLFDKDTATLNYYINSSGEEQANASWSCSDYIEVIVGKPYNFSGVTSYGNAPRTGFYAADKSFVSSRSQSSADFTIPDGVKYMRVSIYKANIDTAVVKQVLSMDNPIPILCNNGEVGSTGYTVVGTPTISSDLVVSGNTASDYVSMFPPSTYRNRNWHLRGFSSITLGTGSDFLAFIGDQYSRFFYHEGWNSILIRFYDVNNTLTSPAIQQVSSKLVNGEFQYDIYYDSTIGYWFTLTQKGTTYTSDIVANTNQLRNPTKDLIMTRNSNNVDLKAITLTVDDTEVYKPELVKILGKNIFDQSQLLKATDWTLTDGWYTGLFSNFNTQFTNGFEIDVPFKEKTVYTLSCKGYVSDEGARARFVFVYTDESTKSLTIDSTTSATYTLTTPSTKTLAKIRGTYASGAGATLYLKDIQLEEGSSVTDFQSYHASPIAVARDLLSCGDYVDEQNITTGEITRKIGYKVLDGTENWVTYSGSSSTGYMYRLENAQAEPSTFLPFCTHFQGVTSNYAIANMVIGEMKCLSNQFYFCTSQDTLAGFKTWLSNQNTAGTPVIVVYPLETSTTETVAAQDTLQNVEGLNTLYITQSAIDGLAMEVTYSAGVEVTIEAVQSANVDQQVEVTIGE